MLQPVKQIQSRTVLRDGETGSFIYILFNSKSIPTSTVSFDIKAGERAK